MFIKSILFLLAASGSLISGEIAAALSESGNCSSFGRERSLDRWFPVTLPAECSRSGDLIPSALYHGVAWETGEVATHSDISGTLRSPSGSASATEDTPASTPRFLPYTLPIRENIFRSGSARPVPRSVNPALLNFYGAQALIAAPRHRAKLMANEIPEITLAGMILSGLFGFSTRQRWMVRTYRAHSTRYFADAGGFPVPSRRGGFATARTARGRR